MLKLIKYLKPFVLPVCAIVALLLIQAACDLSLPDYTSHIVNVGIQQGGIENAVPKAIRPSEFNKLLFFMDGEEKAAVTSHYTLLDRNSLSPADYAHYVKEYPRLADGSVYRLNTGDKKVIDGLNPVMGKAILIVSGIETNRMSDLKAGGTTGAKAAPFMNVPPGTDPFAMLSQMPPAQKEAMQKNISEEVAGLSESMITQSAVLYIHDEYQALGIDTAKLQSRYILYAGGIMLLIALLSMAASVVVGFLAAQVAAGLGRNLRKSVFGQVAGFSNSEFDKFSTASLITRSTNDIQQIQMLMIMLLRIVFYAPILGIGGVIKVYHSNSSMWWIIAVAVIAILSLVAVLFGVAVPKFKLVQKLVDRLNLVTREILTGILVIRAYNRQNHEEGKFGRANLDLTATNLYVSRVMTAMMPLMMLIMNGTTLLIVWIGGHQVDKGFMQVGNMMAFIQYAMQIIMAFLMISMVSIMLPRAFVAAQRIDEVLETKYSISDPPRPWRFGPGSSGRIEFENVSFRYPGADEDVLTGISFSAQPGRTTAFIGSTGSGKTTLINLIPRFYDVTAGRILIDGIDIRNVSQHELRESIGYVPQEGALFSGTIASNVGYGVENAGGEELERAAEIAQAAEFIREKPEGFETEIAQGGTNVSGGQKQRLSIARALLKKPKILIFDDSFSALDFKTDAALRRALKGATADCTVLIVAQRISTIMNADRIIVLDEGRIAGIGTHQELMKECEVYQQIALSQLSMEELA